MEALEILVIILGTFLAIFLALGIFLLVQLVRLAKKIDELSDRAGNFASNFGSNALNLIKSGLTPTVVASGLFKLLRRSYNKRKNSKGER